MRTENTPNRQLRRVNRQGGFSLIEVLVGFLVLLLVLIGLLPMFTRAVIQNIQGRESTIVTNHGGTELENIFQLGFNNWDLEVTAGTLRSSTQFWGNGFQDHIGDGEWLDVYPVTELPLWQRTTEIRQFSINGVNDTDLDGVLDEIVGLEDDDWDGYFDNALPTGTSPNAIHLKEVRVRMTSTRAPIGQGAPTQLTLTSLKAF